MKNILFGLKLLIVVIFFSLGIFAQTASKDNLFKKLTSENWDLIQINQESLADSKINLKLNKADKSISGFGGCNQIYGNFNQKGNQLKFSDISMTKMFCSEGNIMKTESDFVNALRKVTRFTLLENTLTLFEGKREVLRFWNQNPDSENPQLSGKKWVLTKIAYSDVPKTEEKAFIIFDKVKGTISGNTSCNLFNGKYRVNKEKIIFTEIISTKKACLEGNTMKVEMDFLNGLKKTEWYSVLGDRLTLSIGRFNLLTFTEEK